MIECVPNFSEGRDLAVVQQIRDAIAAVPGVLLLGCESDADHNRSVITFVGEPIAVRCAAWAGAIVASWLIDLTKHVGVHPRIGAADVIPFVPLQGASMEDCVACAHWLAAELWREVQVPSYLYEFAARHPSRVKLEDVRRGGFELLRESTTGREPDVGGPALHPTAGASAVGARRILIACNVNLAEPDVRIAKQIAKRIRASSGGFPYVKALGLELASKGMTQVSMNLTNIEVSPLHEVYQAIVDSGAKIAETELIGFIPADAAAAAPEFLSKCRDFGPERILENRIQQARQLA
ncbi:glutamate formiminotransferase [Bryobacterales bacterium F-183]|nr:glutamate formiminotransferase [Bryobacterales bacterium F-183]